MTLSWGIWEMKPLAGKPGAQLNSTVLFLKEEKKAWTQLATSCLCHRTDWVEPWQQGSRAFINRKRVLLSLFKDPDPQMVPAHLSFHSFPALVWLSCPSFHNLLSRTGHYKVLEVQRWNDMDPAFKRETQLWYPGSALEGQCHLLIRAIMKSWRSTRELQGTQWGTDQKEEKMQR